jgi:hypothetical protein
METGAAGVIGDLGQGDAGHGFGFRLLLSLSVTWVCRWRGPSGFKES